MVKWLRRRGALLFGRLVNAGVNSIEQNGATVAKAVAALFETLGGECIYR